jgi:hypothetical protein
MKVFKIKLVRYSTAAGALLAVSGAANASVVQGTIMLNYSGNSDPFYDGDAILDHDDDIVYIDMNNDGIPDFIGYMWSTSSSRAMFFSTYGSGSSNGFFAMDSMYSSMSVKNFGLGDQIGASFSYYDTWGLIGGFSGSGPGSPTTPLGDYFDWDGDHGYIGIGLGTPGSANYGWIEMDLRTDSESAEFIACALETAPNTPITAGNSATVPLLPIASAAGLGLIGLMAALKRRKKTNI